MKQLSQKEFEKCPKWLKKPKTFHSKLETLRYETIPIILFILILWGKNYLLYYRYRCYRYRYRPIWKLSYRYFIGIGRYEKKLIGRTLQFSNIPFVCEYPFSTFPVFIFRPHYICMHCTLHKHIYPIFKLNLVIAIFHLNILKVASPNTILT